MGAGTDFGRAVSIGVLVVGTVTDIRFRRIPNWLILIGALCGGLSVMLTGGPHGLVSILPSALLAAGIAGAFSFWGWLGLGDAKLIVLLVVLLGWYLTVFVLLYACVLAIAWVVFRLVKHNQLGSIWGRGDGSPYSK